MANHMHSLWPGMLGVLALIIGYLVHCSLILHDSVAAGHAACRCTDERAHLGEDILPQLRTLAAWAHQINEPPSWYECPITSVSACLKV